MRYCTKMASRQIYLVYKHAMPPEFSGKWGGVPTAYPAMCGIQREIKKIFTNLKITSIKIRIQIRLVVAQRHKV